MVFETIGRKPKVQHAYPHMGPEDCIIWTKLITNGDVVFDEVWYDVRVGSGVVIADSEAAWFKKMAGAITKKRIDVVGRRGADYWIMEVKPNAGIMALGQSLYYGDAFAREAKAVGNVVPAVVTDSIDVDVLPVFQRFGVVVFVVG